MHAHTNALTQYAHAQTGTQARKHTVDCPSVSNPSPHSASRLASSRSRRKQKGTKRCSPQRAAEYCGGIEYRGVPFSQAPSALMARQAQVAKGYEILVELEAEARRTIPNDKAPQTIVMKGILRGTDSPWCS